MSTHLSFPVTTLADRRRVGKCRNLRPSPSGGLSATGRPRTAAHIGRDDVTLVQGGLFTLPDGSSCMLAVIGGRLHALVDDALCDICAVGDVPRCAIGIDDGFILMPAEGAPRRFALSRTDGDEPAWSETVLFPSLPPLIIARHDTGTATAEVGGVTLRSTYSTTSRRLTDSDQTIVDKALRAAYLRLSDGALSRGHYIQPVVARYRLIGEDGRVLYTSAPVMVAPGNGVQAVTSTLQLSGEGFRQGTLSPLTAAEFVPAIEYTRTPDAVWTALVRSVQLLVSPQLHPYSATLPGSTSGSGSTTTQLTMTARMPGVDPVRSSGDPATRLGAAVAAILDNADTALLPQQLPADTLAELRALQAIAATPPVARTPLTQLSVGLSAPHTFTASAVARSGDLIAWGGLTLNRFDGYSLPEMAISVPRTTGSVPTAVKVTMHDGSSVVRSAVMLQRGEPLMSPLIVYPSSDAVEITLLAGSKALTLPLTPTPCGRAAYWLASDMRPVGLTDERGGFVVPSASPVSRSYPSAVVVCGADDPFAPLAVSFGDGAVLHALLAAPRHSNSFTVPSARFYLFGSGGISSMTLSDSRRRINLNLLDSRGVSRADAVTPMAAGVAALAGGALVVITGSRPVTLLDSCPALRLGWSGRYGELWCLGGAPDDDALVISPDGKTIYSRSGLGITGCVSTGAGMRLLAPGGELLDPSDETDAPVHVTHESTVAHNLKPGACAMLVAGLLGRDVSGSITLGVSHGAPERAGALLCRLDIAGGALNHPLAEPVRVPHSHRLTLNIDITTSHSSSLILTDYE